MKFECIWAKPGIDAKDLTLSWWDNEFTFEARTEKKAIQIAKKNMPKISYKHNGETFKSRIVSLKKIII